MLEHGVYLAPSQFEAGFTSLAHTDEDIEKTIAAARSVLLPGNRMLCMLCCALAVAAAQVAFVPCLLASFPTSAQYLPSLCRPLPEPFLPAGACLRASDQALAAAASKQASEQPACERDGPSRARRTNTPPSLARLWFCSFVSPLVLFPRCSSPLLFTSEHVTGSASAPRRM